MRKTAGAMLIASLVLRPAVGPRATRAIDNGRDAAEPPVGPAGEGHYIMWADGTRLHIEVTGEGEKTVFMVHGRTRNGTIFGYRQTHFMDRFRMVAPDLRGRGKSSVPRNLDFDTDRLAEDMKAPVDYIDPEGFVVTGHGMGGFTALRIALRLGREYRGRPKGLAVVDSSGLDPVAGLVPGTVVERFYPLPPGGALEFLGRHSRSAEKLRVAVADSATAYLMVRWAALGKRPAGGHVGHVRNMVFGTPVTGISLAARGHLDYHRGEGLAGLEIPVMPLVGDRDKPTDLEVNRKTADLIPDARLESSGARGTARY